MDHLVIPEQRVKRSKQHFRLFSNYLFKIIFPKVQMCMLVFEEGEEKEETKRTFSHFPTFKKPCCKYLGTCNSKQIFYVKLWQKSLQSVVSMVSIVISRSPVSSHKGLHYFCRQLISTGGSLELFQQEIKPFNYC